MTKRNTKQTRDSRQERGAGLEPKSSGLEPKSSRQGPHPQGDAPIDEALKRSAARVAPDPGFVDRLGTRLARAHQTRHAPARTVSPRRPWWVWAGGAVAVLVMAVAVAMGLNLEWPAAPIAPVPAATEPVTAESPPAEAPTVAAGARPTAATTPDAAERTPEPEPVFAADLPPAVAASVPRDGDEVSPETEIALQFTQPMDRASVEAALEVSPPVTGTFTWHDDRTVSFGAKTLASATRYQVALGAEARAANGLPLNRDLVFAFTTAAPLTVTHVTPFDGAAGLRGDTPLVLSFNYPLVPINCTGQAAEPQGACASLPLEIAPPVDGQGMWVNSSVYRFDPDPVWTAGTTYTVTVPGGVTSLDGAALADTVTLSFATAAPAVRGMTPEARAANVPLETDVRVAFNTPMDVAVTAGAFELKGPDGAAVAGRVTWEDGGTTLVFTPTAQLATETTYRARLGAPARAASGMPLLTVEGAGVEVGTFTTVPALRVAQITGGWENATQRLAYYENVRVQFAGFVDPATTAGAIRVTEGSGGAEVEPTIHWALNDDPPQAYVSWDRTPGARYCVTVGGDLADRYGNRLLEPTTTCFTIDDMPPILVPITDYETLTLDADAPAQLYFSAVNVTGATFSLGALDEIDYLGYGDEVRLSPASQSWRVQPEGEHNEAVVLPVALNDGEPLPTGFYGLRWDVDGTDNRWRRTLRIAVVDRHVLVKVAADEALVWVTDLRSGQPVAGATVRVAGLTGTELGRGVTDADGLARFPITAGDDRWETVTAITGAPGQPGFGVARTDWNRDVSPWTFDIVYDYGVPAVYRGALQTDRPIYRPGQEVHVWGALRSDDDGRYTRPDPGLRVVLELRTTWDGTLVARAEPALTTEGTFDATFVLGEDAPLGSYYVRLLPDEAAQPTVGEITSVNFTVAAYRKPEFEVTVTPEQGDLLNGEPLRALVDASYYAGGAVSDATVRWTLRARPAQFNPDVAGGWQWAPAGTGGWDGWREPEIIAEGEGRTDANGRLLVTVDQALAPLGEAAPDGAPPSNGAVSAQRWTLEATVVDDTGFPVTQRGDVTVHTGRFYIGLRPQSWVAVAGEAAAVDVRTVDWDGAPVAGQEVSVTLARRRWTHTPTAQPFAPGTWTYEDTPVATLTVTTDRDGEAVARVTPPRSGAYVVLAAGEDGDGNPVRSETHLWVGGPEMAAWQLGEGQVTPVADAERYRPGDVAQILLPTPFEAPYEVLMTLERGGILDVRRFTARESSPLVEIPITDAHAPNLVVAFAVVKGAGTGEFAAPDVRIGMVNLEVTPVAQALNVTVAPRCAGVQDADDLCAYGPGETVELAVRATDAQGQPVDAEVALSVVDKAVLALVEERGPTLLESFYATRPLGVITGDSLLTLHNRLTEDLEALRRRAAKTALEAMIGGIGGGGAGAQAFTPDVRQEFPDTALWLPHLRTGATGETTVSFTLPDTLTTWVAQARAVTAATQVGEATAEFVVTKPLLVRPVTPRFLVAGDRVTVAAVVQNTTAGDLEVRPRLETNLEIVAGPAETVPVPAGGRTRVAWTVRVPMTGAEAAELIFSADGGGYRDATRPGVAGALPIYRYASPEVVSASGALTAAGARVEVLLIPPEAGPDSTLTVRLQPTLAAGMLESLDYLASFPHACTEQVVSRFLPNIATYRALQTLGHADPELARTLAQLVDGALTELAARQNADGGWGWWDEGPSDLQTTAYATLGMLEAQRAGFTVDERRLTDALTFLQRRLEAGLASEARTLPQAFALYVLAEADRAWPEGADQVLFTGRDGLETTGRAYLALALGLRDPEDPQVATLLTELRSEAVVTASGAHWESVASEHWVTWTRATSVVLDVLARLAPEDPLLPPAVRWLMAARQQDRWKTTQETAWAVMALSDYMVATGELDAAYAWGLALNTEALDAGEVTEVDRTEVEHVVPVDELLRDWPNALEISRGAGPGTLYYTADLALSVPAAELAAESRGLTVERRYCRVDHLGDETEGCAPVRAARPGDLIEVQLTVIVPRMRNYVLVEDAYPAGMEPVDPTLATEQAGADPTLTAVGRRGEWRGFDHAELRDAQAVFYAQRLLPGTYQIRYYLRAAVPGTYQVLPAMASEMYFPEVWGRTAGAVFTVEE